MEMKNYIDITKVPEQGETHYAVVPVETKFAVGRIRFRYNNAESFDRRIRGVQDQLDGRRPVRPARPGRPVTAQEALQKELAYWLDMRNHAGQVAVRVESTAPLYQTKAEALAHHKELEAEQAKRDQEDEERQEKEGADLVRIREDDEITYLNLIVRQYPREWAVEVDPYYNVHPDRWLDAARGDGASYGGVAETVEREPDESFHDFWQRAQERADELSLAYSND